MDHLPIFLDVKSKTVLVDGGGTGAARRAERALSAGAKVRLFDPAPGPEVLVLLGREGFVHVPRVPTGDDFSGVVVAYGASDDPTRDALLHREGKAAGALVNVADVKPLCDFITPSVIERDAVTVAISTGGTAPVIGRILRARIEAMLPSGYGKLARFLSRFRGEIETHVSSPRARRRFWENMIEGPVADSFLGGDEARAERLVQEGLVDRQAEDAGGVTLIGAGNGDADLFNFRALGAMQRADLVLHDAELADEVLVLTRRDAERLTPATAAYTIATQAAQAGRRVVWLVAGPAVGDARVEAAHDALRKAGVATTLIPGVATRQHDNVIELPRAHRSAHEMSLTPRQIR